MLSRFRVYSARKFCSIRLASGIVIVGKASGKASANHSALSSASEDGSERGVTRISGYLSIAPSPLAGVQAIVAARRRCRKKRALALCPEARL